MDGLLEALGVVQYPHNERCRQNRVEILKALSLEGSSVLTEEQCRGRAEKISWQPCEQLDPHQRTYAESAELVYWRPWEQLIAHGKNDKESAEMLSWGCAWLIER